MDGSSVASPAAVRYFVLFRPVKGTPNALFAGAKTCSGTLYHFNAPPPIPVHPVAVRGSAEGRAERGNFWDSVIEHSNLAFVRRTGCRARGAIFVATRILNP